MSKLMTVLVVLLSLAVAGLFLVKHKNASLRASLDRANNVASEQQTTITMLKNQLHVALTRADKNELAQVALRQVRIPLYSITDWHRSPISDSHTFDQPGT